ncbi:D-alanyl-D-alanine carboxypeptidase family protein [Paenibacillus protaetiae]|uniref:serine-type D-Ala-D-Ala carboxypeptidase n=1 Tax=Paenibacillus protaetiae TaxID=2509456 RepID=A0A4P6F718_9BACL|nr:D-alanyl-D-alanine carboxypeptidase family protein [Paenibacillus protaetiae]QAY66218.1 D-alanyl-D-alanine carboxypeptidase [Paenibacillus protaetiae]
MKLLKLLLTAAVIALQLPATAFAEEAKAAPNPTSGNTPSAAPALAGSARSAIMMDADTGTVIFEKNSHDKLPPASITKVMTMLLIMEALHNGTIKLTDKVTTSEYAASMGGSQIFLEPGEEMTVDEMLRGIALASGNDASVAMAEKLAGTEQQFVASMNAKAQELGLKDTHFSNCNGLPTADHYTSAHDIAVISRELLKYPEITSYTGLYQDHLRKTSAKPFWLVNTNKLVRFYSGADGLKTGFTTEAKYCLTATAKRDGFRIIAVVMGEPNTKTRNAEVTQMFDYAFAQYMNYPIFKSGDTIGNLKIEKGAVQSMPIVASQPYSVLLRKGADLKNIRHELKMNPSMKAPIAKGQQIGTLAVYQGNQLLKEFPLEAPEAVGKASLWGMMKRSIGGLFK